MLSSSDNSNDKEAVMLKHVLMVVVSAILSALAELLRPRRPLK